MPCQALGLSLSGLCSVAMRETLYAEVDMTDAVVDLVKQGHYLFGRLDHDFRTISAKDPLIVFYHKERRAGKKAGFRHCSEDPRPAEVIVHIT